MNTIASCFKDLDLIATLPAARIHFGSKNEHKTVLGGICTLLAAFSFIFVAIAQLVPILDKR